MVNDPTVHIIMPVKDAIDKAEQAIRAVVASGYTLCVYDDNSEPENALRLDALGAELGIEVVHLSELTSHPSPNYRTRCAAESAGEECIYGDHRERRSHTAEDNRSIDRRAKETGGETCRHGSGRDDRRAREREFPIRICAAVESGRRMQEETFFLLHSVDQGTIAGVRF